MGEFLVGAFGEESNLEWYLTLANDLHEGYLPVWINLLKEIGGIIRKIQGQEVMDHKFRLTRHNDMISILDELG